MHTVAEALAMVMGEVRPAAAVERLALLDAQGRVLAHDVLAETDSPAFDNSAMDGYAVRAADVPTGGTELPLAGESRAGGPPPGALTPGTAMRIFTGAPLPEAADTVVIQENTRALDGRVRIEETPRLGQHVRTRGSDLSRGAVAVGAGHVLGAGELSLLASQDCASCEVSKRPRVAILSSGDELRDIGEPATPGSIVNSNAYMLSALVRAAGGEPWVLPTMPDDLELATKAVTEGLSADALVCTGGVSVGDYDVVPGALARAGARPIFAKVAMKPGKPLAFSMCGTTPVFGLPGNPASAFVGFHLFVAPALRRLAGHARPYHARLPVRLSNAHTRKPGRLEFARARLRVGAEGFEAVLAARQGSGALPALVAVDALVVLPKDQSHFQAGEIVPALLLEGPGSEFAPFDPVD